MIKKTLTFKDIEGKEHTIDAYFHLNEADLSELAVYKKGGLKAYMEACLDTDDNYGTIMFFKKMIETAYGKKVRDPELGTIFMKDPIETAKFMNSEAYVVLLKEIMKDEQIAANFINGLATTGEPATETK